MTLDFARADLGRDRDVLMRFNVEYLNWNDKEVRGRFGLSLPDLVCAGAKLHH